MAIFDVIVIGGGQSGLVTGYFLKQHINDFVILDANEEIGGSWQHYYESLKLFSPAKWAELPGLPFPGDPSHFPNRYEVIDYLREYARVHELPVRSGVRVQRVEKDSDGFTVYTDDGSAYRARAVISATGPFNTPHIPHIPGMEAFKGETLHSYNYHRPEPYAGQHVIVVGSRDSAMQIAYELAQVARVSMAVRHHLKFMPRRFLGFSTFWWLHETGYDELPLGLFTDLKGTDRIMGKEPYQSALANGNPKPKPMFTRMTETGVVWGDGTVENADTVLFATGYRQGLDYLEPLGALDEEGRACHKGGVSDRVPGLFYVGLFGQRSQASATLRGVDRDARIIAKKTAQYLRQQSPQAQQEYASGD
jgi:putative flavoprotein involved in K+ transport